MLYGMLCKLSTTMSTYVPISAGPTMPSNKSTGQSSTGTHPVQASEARFLTICSQMACTARQISFQEPIDWSTVPLMSKWPAKKPHSISWHAHTLTKSSCGKTYITLYWNFLYKIVLAALSTIYLKTGYAKEAGSISAQSNHSTSSNTKAGSCMVTDGMATNVLQQVFFTMDWGV